jgi:hypothetical protein
MSGARLFAGVIGMGLFLPLVLFRLLHLASMKDLVIIAVTLFFGWAIVDVLASILARPRLKDRHPTDALQEWDRQHDDAP